MSQFRRKRILLMVCIALLGLLYWQFSPMWPWPATPFSAMSYAQSDLHVRTGLHYPKYRFDTLEFAPTFHHDWSAFQQKPLHDKCLAFFSHMKQAQPEWRLNAVGQDGHDRLVCHKQLYVQRKLKELKKHKNLAAAEDVSDDELTVINSWLQALVNATATVERAMADDATMLRIFAHCFLGPDGGALVASPELQPLYRWFGERMVPVLLGEFPILERGGGGALVDSFSYESPLYNPDEGILEHYRQHIAGTGIVITATTRFVRPIIKLIRLLRVLGNTLPIQIVYRGDILIRAKAVLQAVATQSKEDMLDPVYTDLKLVEKMYPGFGPDHDAVKNLEYPPQDLTLINVDRAIRGDYKSAMAGFNNKILALFFSTFEKVLLFDADTVPLVPPHEIIASPEFSGSGAYFFQDRSLRDQNDWTETNLFAKLMPHRSNTLDMAMGVRPVTNHTLGNPYMVGWRHYQEAGLLVMDKRRHFGMFMALFALPVWGDIVKSLVWGDKELYWLAMSIVGDEDYHMNKNGAASVGEVTQLNHLKAYNNTQAHELCSSHPGHVNLEGKLLWVNSGFSYCKKNGWVRDSKKFPFSQFAAGEELYKKPLAIRHALVPPQLPMLRLPGGSPDTARQNEFNELFARRKKDVDQMDEDQVHHYSPQKGWVKSSICSNYQYCAYDAIESYLAPNTLDTSGSLFTFLPEEASRFDFLGTMWMSGNRPTKVKTEPTEQKPKTEEAQKPANEPSQPEKPANEPSQPEKSSWQQRPEKLKNDINAVLKNVLKTQKEETLENANKEAENSKDQAEKLKEESDQSKDLSQQLKEQSEQSKEQSEQLVKPQENNS